MSQSISAAASFLNLDMELESSCDLGPLAEALGTKVFVLYCGEAEVGYQLSVEPVIEGALNGDPVACTEHLLGALEGLAQIHRVTLQGCSSRTFDYGFDGGLEANPIHANLSVDHLARMARLGIELRVTVYPFRAHDSNE